MFKTQDASNRSSLFPGPRNQARQFPGDVSKISTRTSVHFQSILSVGPILNGILGLAVDPFQTLSNEKCVRRWLTLDA